jgi:hypothetical protein
MEGSAKQLLSSAEQDLPPLNQSSAANYKVKHKDRQAKRPPAPIFGTIK